jgi:hypothetical protein
MKRISPKGEQVCAAVDRRDGAAACCMVSGVEMAIVHPRDFFHDFALDVSPYEIAYRPLRLKRRWRRIRRGFATS